ncbi:MAG: MmgE/PrpD family protein, partial [Alphaproteobacteria bacterium]|nr:MmgE/PrpD family protein [Alphaproteobacteria bacterium]
MGQPIEAVARFVAETRLAEISETVRRHARLVLLDTLGVILAGSERPEVAALRARLAGGGSGATVYARGWPAQD